MDTRRLNFQPQPRNRTLSLLSISSTHSFSTPSPPSPAPSVLGAHSARGSFSPTDSASMSLKNLMAPKSRQPSRRHTQYDYSPAIASPTIVIHPPPNPPLFSDNSSSTSSSPTLLDVPSLPKRSKTTPLDPIMASVEKKSKFFRDVVQCCTCGKKGASFPKCPRCDEIWCSRECRLVGGKRHVCSRPPRV